MAGGIGTDEFLHKWVCNYGSVEYLAHIKKTRKYNELLMELDKNIMKEWATNEWGHELNSIKGTTFEDIQGNIIMYGQVCPTQPIKYQKDIAIELAKRIIRRSMTTYIPKKHTLFYLWIKELEESEEGIDFVDAVRIYCSNQREVDDKSIALQKSYTQSLNFTTLKWLRAFFHINNPEYE
jgi:hypothetical protein